MLLPLDRKAFDARFVSDKNDYSSEKDRYRFTEYRATASWIVKYYRHRETHDRLMRHILTNQSWERDDNDLYGLMTNGLKAVIEAASTPAAKLEPGQWVWAFEGSPKAVEGYLAAAPEFQNAKVDTFFISFAVDTAIRDIKAEQANGLIFGGGPRRGASYGSCLGLR